MKMKRSQLNLPRISFVVLSFLLCFKAAAAEAAISTGAEWKQDKPPHNTFATRNVRPQQQQLEQLEQSHSRYVRRPQPFNALLTSVGQLSDTPLRKPHHPHALHRHAEHLKLTKNNEHTLKRLVRAVNDGEDDVANDYDEAGLPWPEQTSGDNGGNFVQQWIRDSFGEMFGSVMEWVLRCIDAIWKFFATAEEETK